MLARRCLPLLVASLTVSLVGTARASYAANVDAAQFSVFESAATALPISLEGAIASVSGVESQRMLDEGIHQRQSSQPLEPNHTVQESVTPSLQPEKRDAAPPVVVPSPTPASAAVTTPISVSGTAATSTPAPNPSPASQSTQLSVTPTSEVEIAATAAQGADQLYATPVAVIQTEPPTEYVQSANGVYVPAQYATPSVASLTAPTSALPGSHSAALATGNQSLAVPGNASEGLFISPHSVKVSTTITEPTPVTQPQPVSATGEAASPQAELIPTVASLTAAPSTGNEFPRYPLLALAQVSSPYGTRWGRLHAGVDLSVPGGTPVVASLSGQVVHAGWMEGYGNTVVIVHLNGAIETLYGHLSGFYVQVGQTVQQGQLIAASGSTGYSTGPHLHFEMRQKTGNQWHAVDINQIVATAAQQLNAPATATTAAALPTVNSTTGPEMRVALQTKAGTIQIAASATAYLATPDGAAFASLSPLQPLTLTHSAEGPRAGAARLPAVFFVQPQGGAISVNGIWYRGRVLIADLPGGLTVVNWVNLEEYLVSVVGSEAYPSWKPDALKAQAIAARSYAIWHRYNPASQWYDLAAGPQYQAYEGIQKEFNTTLQAVNATRGQVLVQNGGVVQALYAATQAITDAYHNGFGLSQWGAASMAASGYDYLTILGQFYPGSQLALIPSG